MSTAAAPPAAPPTAVPGASVLRRLVARFRPVRVHAAGVFVLLLLRSGLDVMPPLLVASLVDGLAPVAGRGGPLPPGVVTALVLFAAANLARIVVFYASQVAAARLGQDLENRFRSDLFAAVMRLRFAYHDENRSGATIARSLRDMDKARHFFREVWLGWIEIGLLLVTVLVAATLTSLAYGAVVAVTFTITIALTIRTGRQVAVLDRGVSDDYDEVATTLQENVAGARVVRAFALEEVERSRFDGRMDRFSDRWGASQRYWTGVMPAIHNLYRAATPVVLVVAGARLATGAGSLGEVAAVLLYLRTVEHRVRPFTRLVILGQQAVASGSRVFEVLDDPRTLPAPARPRALPPVGGAVRFEGVRFRHATGPEVLRGVTLDVPAGTSLGILGPTGAGKTSLVGLLPRFYDPEAGRVLLDGVDVRELDPAVLRAAVSLVFQEPFLFSATVAENVAYGRPEATVEEVSEALRLAAADGFVAELPRGVDTVVGERGVSLSGGQRQRLTIARALASHPRVLVLDDATASLDAVTERRLFEGIRRAAGRATVLVISQRVPSVRWCDRIAVLEDGVVTAVGRHEELLQTSPLYAEVAHHQRLEGIVP